MALRSRLLASLLLASLVGGGRALAVSARAGAWVSASARSGDGSRAHPFRTVGEALASGARTVFVAPGRYAERVALRPGVALIGSPGAVLCAPMGEAAASGGEAVVTAEGGRLRNLVIDSGGALALRVRGPVQLEHVRISARGGGGLSVESGSIEWKGGAVTCASGAHTAISLAPGTTAELERVAIEGPFMRGLVAEHARLSLTDVRIRGSALGIRLRGDRARFERVRIERGGDVGLFVGVGALTADRLEVSDHEYGVLAGDGSEVVLRAPSLARNRRAGLAAQHATLTVEGGEIADSGPFGGVQLSNTSAHLERLRVVRSTSEAVAVIGGEAEIRSLTIDGVRDPSGSEGEGILVRRGHAVLGEVSIAHVSGLGLFASEASAVELDRLQLADCEGGSIAAESRSRIEGKVLRLSANRDPDLIATRFGELRFARVDVSPPARLDVHCEEDAPVHIGELTGASSTDGRCLTVDRSR